MDFSKFEKNQQKLLQSAKEASTSVEKNWQNLGVKSDNIYAAMRASAENSYNMIKNHAGTSAAEIVRAEEAKNAKLKALNTEQFGSQTSLLDSLKKNWMAVSAAVYVAWRLIQKAIDLVELGAQVKSVEESFKALSKNAGISGDALIQKLREVTNATVDSSDLMKKANRLIVEGFSAEQIIHIGEAARTAARLMGTDVTTAYESVADAIVNLRQRGLKTAGFVIDLNEAYQKHAERLGIAKDSLNDYGKQMALVAAVHEKNIEMLSKTGSLLDSEYEKIQKQKVMWKEFKEMIAMSAAEVWNLVSAMMEIAVRGGEAVSKAIDWARIKTFGYDKEAVKKMLAEEEHGQAERGAAFVETAKKEQQQMMESLEITKQTLQLRKGILGVGYQTVESKIKELEIDRQLAIMALQKFGNTGGLQAITNKLYDNKKAELQLDERIRIQELQTTAAIKEGLIDLSEIAGPTSEQRLAMTVRTYDREQEVNNVIQYQILEIAKLTGNLGMAQEAERNILKSKIDQGKILKENVDGEKALLDLLQKRAIAEREIQEIQTHGAGNLTLMSNQFDVQRQLRANQVSMGWMRPGQAGLKDLQDEITLRQASLKIEQDVYDQMSVTTHTLDQQEQQWNKILETEKQLKVLDASRGQYLAEYGKTLDGLESGLKKYVTESGTLYTQLETMTYNTAKGMEGAFSSFFQSIFDNTKTWQQKMSGLFKGLADSYIKALSDMAAKALVKNLFGGSSSQGTGSAPGWTSLLTSIVGGIGGLFGGGGGTGGAPMGAQNWNAGAINSMTWLQHGGIVTRPTFAMIGEAGPEAVVPLRNYNFFTSQSRPNQSVSVSVSNNISIPSIPHKKLGAELQKEVEETVIRVVRKYM